MLYEQLKKALYGTLQVALVFWKLLSTKLIAWGFIANPYNQCVANKTINPKQCTIKWHVDDLKISHVEKDMVVDIKIPECEIWERKSTGNSKGESIRLPRDGA